jgi:hypothetical protein
LSADARVQLSVSPERFHLSAKRARPSGKAFSVVTIAVVMFLGIGFGAKSLHAKPLGYLAVTSPFLLVGVFMLRRSLLPLFQMTTIDLARDGGAITTAPLGGTHRLRLADLRVRLGNYPDFNDPESVETGLEGAVLMDHGRQTFSFLISFRRAEQQRVFQALQEWLQAPAKVTS